LDLKFGKSTLLFLSTDGSEFHTLGLQTTNERGPGSVALTYAVEVDFHYVSILKIIIIISRIGNITYIKIIYLYRVYARYK